MSRRGLLAGALASALMILLIHPAGAVIPAVGAISKKNMEWKFNVDGDVGSDIEFLERKLPDGSLKRYAIVGMMGHGFDIIDITNPDLPLIAGVFVDPGFNWEGDIQVNPRRNLVLVATESPGVTVGNGTSGGLAIVDITDVANPVLKSHITLSGGAHNVTIIDDQYAYGLLPTSIVDYSNPTAPVFKGTPPGICGHDLTMDLNIPGRAYTACDFSRKSQILDVSNPLVPKIIAQIPDNKAAIHHQADPSPDSSLLFITDEEGGGLEYEKCPGGGLHVYDISGKYLPNASVTSPKELGHWFAPFYSMTNGPTQEQQWGNCTIHVHNLQAERWLMSVAHYSAGSFVADLSAATVPTGQGQYTEWAGDNGFGGKTTWGNSMGNFLPEGANTWSAKWTRFDDPAFDRYIFTSDITRGMDVLYYTGPMPKKVSRLAVNAETAGAVSGKLDRYAVYTPTGYVNKPLAGKTVTLTVDGGSPVDVTTAADGTFSLALAPGSHTVQATWAGDANYRTETVTQSVTA